MGPIQELAAFHNLPLIEDVSHAPGAKYDGKMVGSFGAVSIVSLHAFKLLWGGEGGVVLTDDEEIHRRAVIFGHNQHRIAELGNRHKYAPYSPFGYGLKLRIHPLAAVLASEALSELSSVVRRQRQTAKLLDNRISRSALLSHPVRGSRSERVYYTYKPLCTSLDLRLVAMIRRAAVRALNEAGIPARIPDSGPLSEHPIFKKQLSSLYGMHELPRQSHAFVGAQTFFSRSITIPFPNQASSDDSALVAAALGDALSKIARYGGN